MKKTFIFMTLAIVLTVVLYVSNSNAASWYTVNVIAAGPMETGGVYVRLSDTATPAGFPEQWFSVPALIGKEVLAVSLTASTNGMPVIILADMNTSPPTVMRFYVVP